MPARLQNWELGQKLGHNSLGFKDGRDPDHLRVDPAVVHQRNARRGEVRPVNSIGRIILFDYLYKESVVDEEEEEEDEEEKRAGGGGQSEEDVGRDKVDITNLMLS